MSGGNGGGNGDGNGGGAFAALVRRGLVQQTTGAAALTRLLDERQVTFYLGIDPTGPSLHAGHLVGLLAMARLQRAGHQPVLLIGGGTARVGDPSDRDDMRPLLPVETVARNAELMRSQVGRFIDLQRTIVVNNADWLPELRYLDFLREIGRHFSVNRMLGFETYRRRLDTGLSFLEFNYLLLQAYDYLELQRRHGCLLQLGGDDQWANILAGVDLIRRVQRVEAHALTWPLVTTADGKKMGKTAAGALFLDPARVSPYQFYQYWINVPDADAPRLLALLTLLPDAAVEELGRLRDRAAGGAKERLAMELTAMVHGEEQARQARETSRALFAAGGGDTAALPSAELPPEMGDSTSLLGLFGDSGLCSTRSDARRLIEQGGAWLDGRVRTDIHEQIDLTGPNELLLRAGKKRYFRFLPRSGYRRR